MLFPLAALVARAFFEGGRFAPGALASMLRDPNHLRAFGNSVLLAVLVAVAGTVLGFLFAFTAVRGGLPRAWMGVLEATALLPLISPPFTTAIAIIFSFGPRGLVTYQLLGLKGVSVYGLGSTFAAETLTYFPLASAARAPACSAR